MSQCQISATSICRGTFSTAALGFQLKAIQNYQTMQRLVPQEAMGTVSDTDNIYLV
jgi:hypothetical protein